MVTVTGQKRQVGTFSTQLEQSLVAAKLKTSNQAALRDIFASILPISNANLQSSIANSEFFY